MAKILLLLFAVCVLPAIVTARFYGSRYEVTGTVYCDTCLCGFENEATQYMPDADVKVECINKATGKVMYTKQGKTDASGHYTIVVHGDRGEDVCDVALVRSSDSECSTPNEGRDRARVILTNNNGMTSYTRFANAMGFMRNSPLASCKEVLQKYQSTEDEF